MASRLAKIKRTNYYSNVANENPYRWNSKTYLVEPALEKPIKRKKPTMYFVCSMGDLFHESVPFEWIDIIFSIMSDCDQHTYQLLTKRPQRVLDFISWKWNKIEENIGMGIPWFPKDNIWIGVSAENQEMANKRIPVLLKIPAKVHFVSVEPMLGSIDLTKIIPEQCKTITMDVLYGYAVNKNKSFRDGLASIDWVICGGESGHNARPMHPDWVRILRDQCKDANVPFFFKNWGEWYPDKKAIFKNKQSVIFGNTVIHKIGKKASGSLLDGKEYKEYPNL
jgi:protein gp37